MSLSDGQYREAAGFESVRRTGDLPASRLGEFQKPLPLRLMFVAVCASAAAAAIYFAGGSAQNADPDLAKLLKGMAIIKTGILLAVSAAIWWRLGFPIRLGFAAGYMLFGAIGVAGAALVWNMAGLALAPFLFDGGLLGFLILALRDDNDPWLRALTRARSRRSD